jgi:hypothetical protein
MAKVKDITGQRFGRLTVLELAGTDKARNYTWLCRCDCGTEKVVSRCNLINGSTKSCGCQSRERLTKHGKSNTRLYRVWATTVYSRKGVGACEEWRNSFPAFYAWAMSHGFQEDAPKGESFIYRIDTKQGYSPENCAVGSARQAHNAQRKKGG